MSPYTTRVLDVTGREWKKKDRLNRQTVESSTNSSQGRDDEPKSSSSGGGHNASSLRRECAYDLSSVIVHIGQINGGHYVCYCRQGRQWYLFDDNKVSAATEKQVLAAQAYLLVYTIRSLT